MELDKVFVWHSGPRMKVVDVLRDNTGTAPAPHELGNLDVGRGWLRASGHVIHGKLAPPRFRANLR